MARKYDIINAEQILKNGISISGRRLHRITNIKTDYAGWIQKKLNICGAVENIDYKRIEIPTMGTRKKYDHILTPETAINLLPIYNVTAKIEELREYLESLCEDTRKEIQVIPVVKQPLKSIEEELQDKDGQIVVSSRDVAVRFGKEHKNVIRAIETLIEESLFSESSILSSQKMFIENAYKVDDNNKLYKEYLMTRDGFTLLAMGFTGKEAFKFKLAYIEAFNKMEEALKSQQPALPTTYKEALVALVAEVEAKERLQLEVKAKEEAIQEMKPKAEFCEEVLEADGAVPINVIAKDYGMSARSMNRLLNQLNIQYQSGGTWVLYAKYQDQGYTTTETGTKDTRFGEYAYVTTKWTQKGRMFIYETLKEHGILPTKEL